jgi:SnoaL-like protein
MAPSLEERLQSLLDTEEIRNLLLDYGITLDQRDLVAYSRLFAKQGSWTGPYVGSATGPDAILKLLEEKLSPHVADTAGAHHLMTNMRISVSGDRATAWSRWTYVVPGPKREPTLLLSGHYDDELVREAGRWRFLSRVVHGDLPGVDE